MAPDAYKLFPPRERTCSLALRDNTAAVTSAASLLTPLLLISSRIRLEVFSKLFAIFMTPDAYKLFPLRQICCSLVL